MADAGSLRKEAPISSTSLKVEGAASKTVYVGNLSYFVEQADLEILFKECGEIVAVRLHTDKEGRFMGFGHVKFATAEAAQKALKFDNTELLRRIIRVRLEGSNTNKAISSASPEVKDAASKTIYVGNLSYFVERDDMEILFKECGEIVAVRLHTDKEGRFMGFGHVEFATAEAAQKALRFHNTELLRRIIHVRLEKKESTTRTTRNSSNSIQKCQPAQNPTIFVKGSVTSLTEEKPVKGLESLEDNEQEIEENCSKEPLKSIKDVEMVDAGCPRKEALISPTTLKEEDAASKTVLVGNLSYCAERADIKTLFQECGEIVDVRLHRDIEGRFKGFGHVEFATAEAAQKALKFHNTEFLSRIIRVRIETKERNTCNRIRNSSYSIEKCQTAQYPTASVKGLDMSLMGEEPKSPTTLKVEDAASKTVFVRNLSYSVERADMEILFKECGEIVDVRLHKDNEGRFIGFAHVEFSTAQAAQEALKFDNTELLRRIINVELVMDKNTSNSRNLTDFNQEYQTDQYQTVFVKGFDTSLPWEKIKACLEEHFSSCGEITRISIPKYLGAVKGFAHLDFKDADSVRKALQLHRTELGGFPLSVEKANPRGSCRTWGGHQFAGRSRDGHEDGGSGWWSGTPNKPRTTESTEWFAEDDKRAIQEKWNFRDNIRTIQGE